MKIEILRFNPFVENTYVIIDKSKKCVIIDPGCHTDRERDFFLNYIKTNELLPQMIINTHCHIDHIAGVDFVKESFNIPFLAHKEEEYLLGDAGEYARQWDYFDIKKNIVIDEYLDENKEYTFGDSVLKIIHTPGHTPGQCAVYSDIEKFMIVGDTIFKGSIGRTDLPGGDYDALENSIKNKILKFDPDFTIFPGHGDSTKVSIEMTENPFINFD